MSSFAAIAVVGLSMPQTSMGSPPPISSAVLTDNAFGALGNVVPCATDDDCSLFGAAVCRNEFCYRPKSRSVSVRPNPANAGLLTARRISLDVGTGSAVVLGWVEEPRVANRAGPGPIPVLVSSIGPNPVYRDWSSNPIDSQGRRVIHVIGCAISNQQTYLIQSNRANADPADEANFSAPLSLPTTAQYGDVSGLAAGSPPDGVPGFNDVMGAVLGFQGDQAAPKTWLKIAPSMEGADPTTISLAAHVFAAVQGFQGAAYTGLAPLDCP
ncbi:MAG: hypothetical protein ACE5E5_12660 [Phycisphaerae bacterium]